MGFGTLQVVLAVKNPPANAGDMRQGFDPCVLPTPGTSPGVGSGNPPQYSCLESSTDRGAWQATVHKSQTWLSDRARLWMGFREGWESLKQE